MRVHAFEWVQHSGCTSADVSGCLCFPDMRAALLLNSCSPNSRVQFIAVAVYNFFSDRTNQNDDVFPGPPFFSRSVGEPTWFSEMLCPVTVCVHIYIYLYFSSELSSSHGFSFWEGTRQTGVVQAGKKNGIITNKHSGSKVHFCRRWLLKLWSKQKW